MNTSLSATLFFLLFCSAACADTGQTCTRMDLGTNQSACNHAHLREAIQNERDGHGLHLLQLKGVQVPNEELGFLLKKGANKCPAGYSKIPSVEACQAAANAMGQVFAGGGVHHVDPTEFPTSCYSVEAYNMQVFKWNPGKGNGKANPGVSLVCKLSTADFKQVGSNCECRAQVSKDIKQTRAECAAACKAHANSAVYHSP
mmetsp:Transcript_129779/g.225543  ORF Transcript_129779/g.225543 Transcript_129779/m.225543 type:complete len:201 (-) Transcript_129779:65-667(-)